MKTEKTILEWYELLPEPIRSQAIDNYDEIEIISTSLHAAIEDGFSWTFSNEKWDYWNEIREKAFCGDYATKPTTETIYKHSSGALVWFPDGRFYNGNVGMVVQAAHPWRLYQTFNHWHDLEPTNHKLEIKIIEQ